MKLDDHHFRHRKTQIHLSSYKAPVKYTLQSASWNKQLKEIMINEVEEERGHIVIFWNEEPEEIPQKPKTSKQQITSINKMVNGGDNFISQLNSGWPLMRAQQKTTY